MCLKFYHCYSVVCEFTLLTFILYGTYSYDSTNCILMMGILKVMSVKNDLKEFHSQGDRGICNQREFAQETKVIFLVWKLLSALL